MFTTRIKNLKVLAFTASVAAAAALSTGSANAIPLLETTENVTVANGFAQNLSDAIAAEYTAQQIIDHGIADGLIYNNNVSGGASDPNVFQVARVNSAVLGVEVDALAKIDLDTNQFINYDPRVTNASALSISCTSAKCASFDWSFDQSETELPNDWNIVKFGVKYGGGEGPAYFLVEEFGVGADSGSFDLGDYIDLANPDPDNPLYQFFNPNNGNLNGLSHFDVFGSTQGGEVPEPGALALLGLALVGLGMARRRKRS